MSFRNLSKDFRYVNENGDSITFVYENGYVINKPQGIDTLNISHNQAQGINQVGTTIQSSNVQSRPVTISGILVGSFQAENKTKLLSVVRPDLSARLYAGDYYLTVRPSSTPTIEPKPRFSAFQFQLLAAYPYWQKDDSASATLSGIAKRFKLWDNTKAARTGGDGRWWNISGGGNSHSESGGVVTFNNPAEITALSVAVEPVQSGSGDPSPNNIRPISGWDSVNIWNKPTHDTSADPTVTIQLGQTVYGTLDVTGGTMTVDRRFITLDGVNKKVVAGYGALGPKRLPVVYLNNQEKAINQSDYDYIRSSYLKTGNFMNAENSIGVGNGGNALPVHIGTIQGTDGTHGYNSDAELIAAANAYLQEHPLQICYNLATPIEISLTPTQIATLVGQNNVWSDAGDVTVTYVSSPTPYRFGEVIAAQFINVRNDGQVPIPFTATFKAVGEVTNPRLIDAATNKYLLLNKTLVAGESVTVEITHERTYVNSSVDGECRGALDLTSSFFRLAVGDNVIKPEATSGKNNLKVDIDFATEVVGIAL